MDLLDQLTEANRRRCPAFGHTLEQWTPSDWGNAVAGEAGALCTLIKRMNRGDKPDMPVPGYWRKMIAKEAADIVVYLDLLCQRLGVNLPDAIVERFNQKSVEMDCDEIYLVAPKQLLALDEKQTMVSLNDGATGAGQ